MLARLRQFIHSEAWRHGDRPWYSSLGLSAALHIGLVALLAGIWLSPQTSEAVAVVEANFPPRAVEGNETFNAEGSLLHSGALPQANEGGGVVSPIKLANENRVSFQVKAPAVHASATTGSGPNFSNADPLAEIGGLPGGGGSRGKGGSGHGEGDGHGDGAGSGFFGSGSTAKSAVFVVDASDSMNARHNSEARTRFGKLKLELLNSISRMNSEQSFYIIFFNGDTIPMPADSLQPATPEAQTRFLEWVAGVRTGGSTDPRGALMAALELKPDVIFFLTDGDFLPTIRRDLQKLKQSQVVINTIGFGSDSAKAETILRKMAQSNGGTYQFVP